MRPIGTRAERKALGWLWGERGAEALDLRGDRGLRFDRLTRMRDHQALVKMHHPLLNAHRALAETAQGGRQLFQDLGPVAVLLAGKLDAHAFGSGFAGGQFAFIDRTLEQKPGGDLHQTGGQAHALGRIGESGRTRKSARFRSPRTVEVSSSLFDQRHAFSKEVFECGGRGETMDEWNRVRRLRGRSETARRSFVLMTHTPSLPSRGGEAAYTAAAPFAAASDHSARAAPSAHLPLSKVNG